MSFVSKGFSVALQIAARLNALIVIKEVSTFNNIIIDESKIFMCADNVYSYKLEVSSNLGLLLQNQDIVNASSNFQEKVFVGLENVDLKFCLILKIVGPNGSFLRHIRESTGAGISLQGKGSGYIENASGKEGYAPLHIHLTHSKRENLQLAKCLTQNLFDTIHKDYLIYQHSKSSEVVVPQIGRQFVSHNQNSVLMKTTQISPLSYPPIHYPNSMSLQASGQEHFQLSSIPPSASPGSLNSKNDKFSSDFNTNIPNIYQSHDSKDSDVNIYDPFSLENLIEEDEISCSEKSATNQLNNAPSNHELFREDSFVKPNFPPVSHIRRKQHHSHAKDLAMGQTKNSEPAVLNSNTMKGLVDYDSDDD